MSNIVSCNAIIEEFYREEKEFRYFEYISKKDYKTLNEKAISIKEYLKSKYRTYALGYGEYIDTLEYLNEAYSNGDVTFDEKIVLLILIRDSNLEIYYAHAKNPLYTKEDIENEKDEFNRNHMIMHNVRNNGKIEQTIKSSLGFIDERMFFYETIYMNKLLCKNEINTCILEDNTRTLLSEVSFINNLDMIDYEVWSKLIDASKKFCQKVKKPNKEIVSNALVFRQDFFGISSIVEQIILFILILDPNFYLITIFEEESRFEEVKKRALQVLGFYHKDLITIEKMMIEKYFPDHKTSIWSYQYKL